MFATSLQDAGFGLAALMALAAGVLSFLSPCVLPVVPPYLAYMSGISISELSGAAAPKVADRRRGALLPALFFVMGLSTVFLLLGIAASALGRVLLPWLSWLNLVSGAMVVILGLHFLHVFRIPLLDREARIDAGDRGGSALGAYVLGLAFAFGWTPCIGPQLGAILSLAAQEASVGRGMILLAVYAAGLGIPFVLVALFMGRAIGLMARVKKHMGLIERLMGILLILVGIALMTGFFSSFSNWLLTQFPGLATLG